jgi:hypothetical protein
VPFTPFHFGPGLLLKAVAPGRVSFTAYAAAQVVIDVESGYYLLTQQSPVHRGLHTFALGGLAGALSGALAGWVGRRLLPRIARDPRPLVAAELSARGALAGGLAGGLAHALLDGMMHFDMHPFAPFTQSNPLLGLLTLGGLHLLCLISGAVGLLLLVRPTLWRRRDAPA